MLKIRTIAAFITSLDESQRRFFIDHEQDAERRIQQTLVDLGRGLSGISELHGRAVAARFECMDRGNQPTRTARSRPAAGGGKARS